MKIINELKEFIFRGNVIDMAVGVIVGSAFGAIVTSLVNDMFMPVISLLVGKMDFSKLYIPLDGNDYVSLSAAEDAGAAVLKYGSFITQVINFLLIAICIFFFVKLINGLMTKMIPKKEEAPQKEVRKCPYCFGELDDKATRCPHCTSDVSDSVVLD